jgi:hypothetical protein
VIAASRQACGVVLPLATSTSDLPEQIHNLPRSVPLRGHDQSDQKEFTVIFTWYKTLVTSKAVSRHNVANLWTNSQLG